MNPQILIPSPPPIPQNSENQTAKVLQEQVMKQTANIQVISTGVQDSSVDKSNRTECERCGFWIPNDYCKQHQISHSSKILPWLFLGGQGNANNYDVKLNKQNEELTKQTNITYVLNVSSENANSYPPQFKYLHLKIRDEMDENIQNHFQRAFEFMEQCKNEGANMLVHCMLGMSRSATVVLMYLMRGEKMSLKEAWELTKNARYIVKPNPVFTIALVKLEFELFGVNSIKAIDMNNLCLQMQN